MKTTVAASAAALLALAQQGSAAALASRSPECNCCNILAKDSSLRGKVFGPDDQFYDDRLAEYYSANAAEEPWCMVMPTSTEDVSKIAKVISTKQCPFGMRSGAHSSWAGSNGVADGITVDFGWMNTTTYDADNKLARIQPGSDWERVFKTLDPYGVAGIGGRASVVGVGGFTTGGGYSFHTNTHGFACDAVKNFEVVLADGSVVNANAEENHELYISLKGGSGNFGFVTRVDQHVHEGTQMWGGISTYDFEHSEEIYNAYLNFAENMDKDRASQNIMALVYNTDTGLILTAILTNIDAKENATAFDEYFAVESISSTNRVGAVAELVPEFTGPTPLGQYANWMVGATTNDLRVIQYMEKTLREYIAKMEEAAPDAKINIICQFQPVTQSIVDNGHKTGGNALGLEEHVADGPVIMWLFALTIDSEENQEVVLPIGVEFRKNVEEWTAKEGLVVDWEFLNYAWKDQDPISKYGAENIARMQEASAKHDPNGVFQTLRKGGFKIPA